MLEVFTIFCLLSWAWVPSVSGQDNTACVGTGLDWYTSYVGETPCQTYEQLRQICNPNYKLGLLNVSTIPPDTCNDVPGDCCCNSMAFDLSMLCLNCQHDIGNGPGYDANNDAYWIYLTQSDGSQCSPILNQSFPTSVQQSVCSSTQLKIEDDIYRRIFWNVGTWFYQFTKDTILQDRIANNNNTFTQCSLLLSSTTTSSQPVSASSSSSPASSSPTSLSTSSSAQTQSSSVTSTSTSAAVGTESSINSLSKSGSRSALNHPGPIVGIVLGILVFLGALLVSLWLLRKRRLHRNQSITIEPDSDPEPYTTTPFISETWPPAPSMSNNNLWTLSPTGGMTSSKDTITSSSVSGPSPVPSTLPYVRSELAESGPSRLPLPSPNEPMLERHVDAGSIAVLGRSPSGRLPPAYRDDF